jgi:peptidoglycan/xylan/chitin deacetylase (PgdA/CDA1 family)
MRAVAVRRSARAALKGLAAAVIRFAGLGALARLTWTRRGVGIIVYHDPSPERLDAHLRYLASRYSLVDMAQVEAALKSGDWTQLPTNAVLLTFDDGHAGNARLAPVLEGYGARPVIYVCPGVIDGDGQFWFTTPTVDPEPLKLMVTAARAAVVEAADAGGIRRRDALEADDLRALSRVADIGSHTLTHPILPLCSDDEAEREIVVSRTQVSELTGLPCQHFSYPNGDYSTREMGLVHEAGYATARTTEPGWNKPDCDSLRLRIASLADHCSVNELAADLAGLFPVKRRRKDAVRRRQLAARQR